MISVIMGVYNAQKESMFQKSINSILQQSFDDFELIICDDGSTDNTYNMLKQIAKKDKRVVLIKNEKNQGLAFSLNQCIKASKCDILIRHDIDDYSDLTRFQKQVDFLNNNPSFALVGSNISLHSNNNIWGKMEYPESPTKKDFLFCLPFMHGSIAMRKEAVMDVGGYSVTKKTRRTEDFDLFARMYVAGSKGYNFQEILYNYKEDSDAQKKRKFKYRVDESRVKLRAFKELGLMPKGLIYAIKPIIVGFIPKKNLNYFKDKYYKRRKIC